jgi:beta-glucosidase
VHEEVGHRRLLVSDYFAINLIHTCHKAAADVESAARMALDAGVDVELPSTDCYGAPLVRAVREGLVDEAKVDETALRVLKMKFALGLFENPFVDEGRVETHSTRRPHAFALKGVEQSLTLLKTTGGACPSQEDPQNRASGPTRTTCATCGRLHVPGPVESGSIKRG